MRNEVRVQSVSSSQEGRAAVCMTAKNKSNTSLISCETIRSLLHTFHAVVVKMQAESLLASLG